MLLNLKTIHKPVALDEALDLLAQPGTVALYGGAALQRHPDPAVEAVVDLTRLNLAGVQEEAGALVLGSMLTLEVVRDHCLTRAEQSPNLRALADLLAMDQPETLRNTYTLGDLLVEADPQSMALTLLLALHAEIEHAGEHLITGLRVPLGTSDSRIAYEKVARTPADAPIVGAVASAQPGEEPVLALCGVAPAPIIQQPDTLTIDPPSDHWGSAEYRANMARVLSRRVLDAVTGQ